MHHRSALRSHLVKATLALLFVAFRAGAQQTTAPQKPLPPPGELLKPPPSYSQWTVTYTPYRDPSATNATPPTLPKSSPKQVSITKTADIFHEEVIDGSGSKSERWQSGRTLYLKPAGQTSWKICEPEFLKAMASYGPSFLMIKGFDGLDWVGPQSYAGVLTRPENNAQMLLFLPAGGPQGATWTVEKALAQPQIALVDLETRLPILQKKDGMIQSYQFGSAPMALQKLPSDLAKQVQKLKESEARVFAPPKL